MSFGLLVAPPSYEECVMGAVDIYHSDEMDMEDGDVKGSASRRVHGNVMWAPSYPFYRTLDNVTEDDTKL